MAKYAINQVFYYLDTALSSFSDRRVLYAAVARLGPVALPTLPVSTSVYCCLLSSIFPNTLFTVVRGISAERNMLPTPERTVSGVVTIALVIASGSLIPILLIACVTSAVALEIVELTAGAYSSLARDLRSSYTARSSSSLCTFDEPSEATGSEAGQLV